MHQPERRPDGYSLADPELASWRRVLSDAVVVGVTGGATWFCRHWLALVNGTHVVTLAGAAAIPYLWSRGLDTIARPAFDLYHLVCQQTPTRSYFLFGQQMALCQRDLAIFGALLLVGLAYALLRGRMRGLSWRGLALLALPLVVDGFTQMFGWRESTWWLRTATGFLFGAACVWFLYPWFDGLARQILRVLTPVEELVPTARVPHADSLAS